MRVARLAGCEDVQLLYAKGTLIISNSRLTQGVVNRLRPPGDGDILVPGGTVSLLGTTSDTVDDPDGVRPTPEEAERILREGAAMLPGLANTRFIRAFSGVRPLLQSADAGADGRGAIALRSRIGKGACQGAFCSARVTSHLYGRGIYEGSEGLHHMRDFLGERFKGIRPVLWGRQMPQMELAEALHCGLMGLDFLEDDEAGE